jgi:hypothetical protein
MRSDVKEMHEISFGLKRLLNRLKLDTVMQEGKKMDKDQTLPLRNFAQN